MVHRGEGSLRLCPRDLHPRQGSLGSCCAGKVNPESKQPGGVASKMKDKNDQETHDLENGSRRKRESAPGHTVLLYWPAPQGPWTILAGGWPPGCAQQTVALDQHTWSLAL